MCGLIKSFVSLIKLTVCNGFLLLQETHSTVNDGIKWTDDFKGEVFYSHSMSN